MIYTVECPQGHKVVETFPMIEATTLVGLSDRGFFKKLFEGGGASHQDAMDALAQELPKGANAVVAARVATTAITDGQGAIHLCVTYIGTPVRLDPPPTAKKEITEPGR